MTPQRGTSAQSTPRTAASAAAPLEAHSLAEAVVRAGAHGATLGVVARPPDLHRLRYLLPHTIWIAYAKALTGLLGSGVWQLPPRSFERALLAALRDPALHHLAVRDLRSALPGVMMFWLAVGAWRAWRSRRGGADPDRLPWAV